jgi:tetratricopeptide (TPR) repeat protein
MSRSRARVVCAGALAALAGLHVVAAQERPRPAGPLEQTFAAFARGDDDSVARAFQKSLDFQMLRLADQRRMERWLGPWNRARSVFVLELANQASLVAPAYTIPLLTAGRQHILRSPVPGDLAPAARTFERLWHQTAIAILQRYQLSPEIEAYAEAIARSRPALDAELSARLQFARGVAQEQRCWNERPVLTRAGTPIRETNVAARSPDGKPPAPPARPRDDVARRIACLSETADRYRAVPPASEAGADARLRLAWVQIQLGEYSEARRSLDGLESAGGDRHVQYLARLFRGRIASAASQHAEAEQAYRSALAIFPEAQSAGIGAALALFEMHRAAEAEAAATAVRDRSSKAVDPWWTYLAADARFIDRWLADLRRGLR